MSEKLLNRLPEVFVSRADLTVTISRAVKAKRLRKLASRLYTINMVDAPENIIKRHLWQIIGDYFPGGLIADRTALENSPASDGSICLITPKGKNIILPGGIKLRPRKGIGPLENDLPFINGLFICSTARAYLENMSVSRARSSSQPRTLTKQELEVRLDKLIRISGKDALNSLRDEVRVLATKLQMNTEATSFDKIAGALLGTRSLALESKVARARNVGHPYDPERLLLFQSLYTTLKNTPPTTLPTKSRNAEGAASLAFFDSYFSNFIEGTEFEVKEAVNIVFKGTIPRSRSEDAHDVLGTWRIISSTHEMNQTPKKAEDLFKLLKYRHAIIMESRLDKNPGLFKEKNNRAGSTTFVEPDLVEGTLKMGFDIYLGLETPFQRAVFMMFLISEVHPFEDGNGRTARIMMNAELISAGEERIVIPTVYRNNYLSSLKAISQSGHAEALIRTLSFAQKWTNRVNWGDVSNTEQELILCNAFIDSAQADDEGKILKMPKTL